MRLEFVLNVEKEMASLTEDEIGVCTEFLRGSAILWGTSDPSYKSKNNSRMLFCISPKRLVGAAGWSRSVHVQN